MWLEDDRAKVDGLVRDVFGLLGVDPEPWGGFPLLSGGGAGVGARSP